MRHEFSVLYHRGCNDGIAAAWAARERLGSNTTYRPYQYGDAIPDGLVGKHLILVDLSMPADLIKELLRSGVLSVMVIDHHKSAIKHLDAAYATPCHTFDQYLSLLDVDTPGHIKVFKSFTMKYCGAVLTWAFFNNHDWMLPEELWRPLMPKVLTYMEDYDLWKRKLPYVDEVNAWLINGNQKMENVAKIILPNGDIHPEVLNVGIALINYDRKIAKSVIREYTREVILDDGKRMALINAPHHLRNMIGDMLAEQYDMVACFTVRREKVIYSLRSGGRYDATVFSEAYGGGGHADAAAFTTLTMGLPAIATQMPFHKLTLRRRLRNAWTALTARSSL